MARAETPGRLETPLGGRRAGSFRSSGDRDRFGRFTEWVARAMGTPMFLLALTAFAGIWMLWNTCAPKEWQFDRADFGFTALTLVLSLQASYAAPLILLAQNRQDDRDRVQIEQDRQRAERNLADTEYLAREVIALRLALKDIPSREILRNELRAFLDELDRRDTSSLQPENHESVNSSPPTGSPKTGPGKTSNTPDSPTNVTKSER